MLHVECVLIGSIVFNESSNIIRVIFYMAFVLYFHPTLSIFAFSTEARDYQSH